MKTQQVNKILKKYKAKSNNETIFEHNKKLFKVLKQLKTILNLSHKEYLLLRKSILYHDIGKITDDFQENITSKFRKCRHEILSASLIDLTEIQRLSIITHHKTLNDLYGLIQTPRQEKSYQQELENFKSKSDNIDTLDIKPKILEYIKNEELLKSKQAILHKGILNQCDHLASANITKISTGLNTTEIFKFDSYNSMQQVCKQTKEDCLLIGRTGLGKTEASLFWSNSIQNQTKSRRIYYILPFTASINAMYTRLKNEGIDVGMLHSKAEYFLSKELDNINVKQEYQTFKNLIKQVTVCTIFQIVKAFFNCKFSEMILSMFENSIFIIDEIHAFDTKTLCYILESLKYLKDNYNISICIMSASIPQPLIDLIQNKLSIYKIISPTIKENYIQRHKLHYKNYFIENDFEHIKNQLLSTNKKVLICVNTVQKAIDTYYYFEKFCIHNKINIKMLHGKFNARSRERIEKELYDKSNNIKLLIGTQALEVSLNIDYDELYTEIAPIDSLIQRFGRVNRKRIVTDIKNIYIYNCDYKNIPFYDKEILNNTCKTIQNIDILNENKVQEYLNHVYQNMDIETYNKYANLYVNSVINEYKVSHYDKNYSDKMIEGDNYSVICINLKNEYDTYIANNDYLTANSLTVNLSKGQYYKLKQKGLIDNNDICYINYNEDIGLDISKFE